MFSRLFSFLCYFPTVLFLASCAPLEPETYQRDYDYFDGRETYDEPDYYDYYGSALDDTDEDWFYDYYEYDEDWDDYDYLDYDYEYDWVEDEYEWEIDREL